MIINGIYYTFTLVNNYFSTMFSGIYLGMSVIGNTLKGNTCTFSPQIIETNKVDSLKHVS